MVATVHMTPPDKSVSSSFKLNGLAGASQRRSTAWATARDVPAFRTGQVVLNSHAARPERLEGFCLAAAQQSEAPQPACSCAAMGCAASQPA